MLRHSALITVALKSAWMLTRENRPPSWKAPMTTVTVGISRKIVRYPRNGTRPSDDVSELRLLTPSPFAPRGVGTGSADGLGPVVGEVRRVLLRLVVRRDHGLTGDLRQRGVQLLVDGAGLHHRIGADRSGTALEPEVLTLVRVEELLPQPGRRRVRSIGVDRLEVVAGDQGLLRHEDLPAGDVLHQCGV